MIVTDALGKRKSGKITKGFYMDRWLKQNLDDIPAFLNKAWDVVGIVSGHGKVRIGKSTVALQVAYYISWILAGGKVIADEKGNAVQVIPPKKKVQFTLDNVVFSPDDLMKQAAKLPPQSVIVYDEGRAGLDSARAMQAINKGMEDFFQECGIYNHVIIIVLPSYFKLHEDYAVARSIFLIDAFTDKKFNRGYFNFYNETQKEWLYFLGKKKIGAGAKYSAANESFWGKFTSWLPFDKDEYEQKKKDAIKKKRVTNLQKKFKKQRDAAIYLCKRYSGRTRKELAQELSALSDSRVTGEVVKLAISHITHSSVDED